MESDDTLFLPTRLKFAWLGLGGLLKAPCSRRVESRGAAWAGGIEKAPIGSKHGKGQTKSGWRGRRCCLVLKTFQHFSLRSLRKAGVVVKGSCVPTISASNHPFCSGVRMCWEKLRCFFVRGPIYLDARTRSAHCRFFKDIVKAKWNTKTTNQTNYTHTFTIHFFCGMCSNVYIHWFTLYNLCFYLGRSHGVCDWSLGYFFSEALLAVASKVLVGVRSCLGTPGGSNIEIRGWSPLLPKTSLNILIEQTIWRFPKIGVYTPKSSIWVGFFIINP